MKSITSGLLMALLLVAGGVLGQAPPLSFVNYGEAEGMHSNTVSDLARDAAGFVWLATSRGLHRFDGYRFKVYQHVAGDTTSLADSHTSVVFVDQEDRLWVGTNEGGLARFDRAKEAFRTYRNRTGKALHLSHNQVTGVAQTPAGELWVATANGYNLWQPATDGFAIYHAPPAYYLPETDIAHLPTILAPAAAPHSPATQRALSGVDRTNTLRALTEWAGYMYYDEQHAYEALAAALSPTIATDLWPTLLARLRQEGNGNLSTTTYNNITAIHADSLGNVFLGYRNGGVARLRAGEEHPTILQANRNQRVVHQLPASGLEAGGRPALPGAPAPGYSNHGSE
ncbi:MAG: two-component regulator propeller domain-containing protein [Bacteroidota bacterium]